MDEITPATREPVPPELVAIDGYLAEALRVPPLDQRAAETLARSVMRRSEEMVWAQTSRTGPAVNVAGGAQMSRNDFGRRSLRRTIWYGATGVVAAALFVVAGWSNIARQLWRQAPAPMVSYVTANGQRGTIMLPDGSTVLLNAASRLEVPANYAEGNRAVRLVGEGLFTVASHVGNPFTVVAGPTTARVLGTSFVVRRYGMDTTTTVAVRTGKVVIGTTIVVAGRLVEIHPNGMARIARADASRFGFAAGVLALRNMTLSQAIPELDRWYDADVKLGDPALAAVPIEGDFMAGSLADLTESLVVTFGVRVVRDGRVLTLFPR